MQTSKALDMQRRHAEQSKGKDIRAYAAEMLRRAGERKPPKSKGCASRKYDKPKQQATRPVEKRRTPRESNMMAPNSTLNHRYSACEIGEGDGQGMDAAHFQELLAAVKTGLDVLSQSHCAIMTPGLVENAGSAHENYHGRGINTHESLPIRRQTTNMGGKNGTRAISDGVAKKRSSKRRASSLKKNDFVCPYDHCGKSFESRHKLNGHIRSHNGEMPYACPKTEGGCSLSFARRSSLLHHLLTVHKDVVPITQNDARERATAGQVSQSVQGVPRVSAGVSNIKSPGSPVPGVSKNGRIKKAPKKQHGTKRCRFPAVAVRQQTALDLAQLHTAAPRTSSSQAEGEPLPESLAHAKNGGGVPSTVCEGLFEGMDASYLDWFPLSKLNLPPPEVFFAGTSGSTLGSIATQR